MAHGTLHIPPGRVHAPLTGLQVNGDPIITKGNQLVDALVPPTQVEGAYSEHAMRRRSDNAQNNVHRMGEGSGGKTSWPIDIRQPAETDSPAHAEQSEASHGTNEGGEGGGEDAGGGVGGGGKGDWSSTSGPKQLRSTSEQRIAQRRRGAEPPRLPRAQCRKGAHVWRAVRRE